jgi:hypothetical protein
MSFFFVKTTQLEGMKCKLFIFIISILNNITEVSPYFVIISEMPIIQVFGFLAHADLVFGGQS